MTEGWADVLVEPSTPGRHLLMRALWINQYRVVRSGRCRLGEELWKPHVWLKRPQGLLFQQSIGALLSLPAHISSLGCALPAEAESPLLRVEWLMRRTTTYCRQ